jgi:hypothetical protein
MSEEETRRPARSAEQWNLRPDGTVKRQKTPATLTELLPDLGRPDDRPELDLEHAKGTLVDELDSVVDDFVLPVREEHAG